MTYRIVDGNLEADWCELKRAPKNSAEGFTNTCVVKRAPLPPRVADSDIDLVLNTVVYSYIEKPSSVSEHTRNLISALLELKERRLEDVT